jgi:hypothetical protein
MEKINLVEDALPNPLFRRLGRALRAVGTERMEDMGSYSTTFWFPVGTKPRNVVEEAVSLLFTMVQPGPACIGMEWWLGRLKRGESLPFHTDRDRSLRKETGQIVHPLWSSILYLNRFPLSPTIVLDQVLSSDGKSWIPAKAECGQTLDAIPNHYVVFRGDLRHGVVARDEARATDEHAKEAANSQELRLTLLINYWDRRPAPPNCRDYDGNIYPAIQNEGGRAADGRRRTSTSPMSGSSNESLQR